MRVVADFQDPDGVTHEASACCDEDLETNAFEIEDLEIDNVLVGDDHPLADLARDAIGAAWPHASYDAD